MPSSCSTLHSLVAPKTLFLFPWQTKPRNCGIARSFRYLNNSITSYLMWKKRISLPETGYRWGYPRHCAEWRPCLYRCTFQEPFTFFETPGLGLTSFPTLDFQIFRAGLVALKTSWKPNSLMPPTRLMNQGAAGVGDGAVTQSLPLIQKQSRGTRNIIKTPSHHHAHEKIFVQSSFTLVENRGLPWRSRPVLGFSAQYMATSQSNDPSRFPFLSQFQCRKMP